MENLFRYISYLMKYFNLLIDTEDAAELMKQEIKTKTYQRDRCVRLREECVKVYGDLFQTFDRDLIDLSTELSIEIAKRDSAGQRQIYSQVFDIINQFANRFNGVNQKQGFSEELIGSKFTKVNVEGADGTNRETSIEYNFSIAFLANDLANKFNQLQTVINEKFKFLNSGNAAKGGQSDIGLSDFIDPLLIQRFTEIENQVTGGKGCKWAAAKIRVAAFCELLYEKKYFVSKPNAAGKRPLNFINNFAKGRYGADISTQLKQAKNSEREVHKNNTVLKEKPLKKYFE